MKFLKTTDRNSGEEIQLSYCDYGQGKPVVLIHGWPLSKEMWEYQLEPLVNAGLRVVKYDRRGFGKSSKPWDGYDYDSFADDLDAVMTGLDLRDATIVGFSMGGGEAVRYLKRYGSDRVARIVLAGSVTPMLGKTSDNPDGVDESVFAEMLQGIASDRIAFLDDFGKTFFGVGLISHPVSSPLLEYYRMLASFASQRSTKQAALAFAHTDFRDDCASVKVPTLIIHGSADKTVPIAVSGERTAQLIPGAEFIVYDGAPHGLFYTHKERLNKDLIRFIQGSGTIGAGSTTKTAERRSI
ncbi:alpha/beta hydrolase [Flaviaesturariibacter flavus]|uniref:Alpha/beta hydrolase n=1 Tax=Flaviaesturariibacter flavus TaxID=2502780 RepID=A0A4R1B9Y4_9BACT|nr:alpha/beta hydrolase [Flaviaesturariibacter flavus]TCJ13733.1 alpha/beta hydrolase [Flaviaesturariibacter flavus]